jgi:hypothetical protein
MGVDMMREQMIKRGLSGAFLIGLATSGAVAACSAGSNNDGRNGAGGGFPGGGTTSGGGFGNTGALNQGGDGTIIIPPNGIDSGVKGAGGAPTTDSDGHIGPASINTCADASKFQGGGGTNRLIYPYDGTIFPRGLVGPLLMWDAQADQILIQAKSAKFTYVDCPQTPDKIRFQIPKAVWDGAGSWSDGPNDPLVVTVTALAGGAALAPVTAGLKFALATMKGAIYYNTYDSVIGNHNGAVLKLIPGQDKPTLFLTDTGTPPLGPCRSCHALSADGMTMTANHHTYPGVYISESYNVTGPTPTLIQANLPEAGFAGIYPDGSRLMTNGPPNASASIFFPTAPGDVTALVQSTSQMLEVKTGNVLKPAGWNAPHAQMPMFSPDGKHIVYNDYDQGQGHSLFMADYDYASNAFSNPRQVFTDATLYAAWPFFTPDSKEIIFATDTRADFTSQVPDPGLAINFTTGQLQLTPTGHGHLMVIDVATKTATKLDLANGYKGGQTYLPAGEARDNDREFFPTVTPIAAGGFYWALFTSRRTYGNLWTKDIEDQTTKKIWVSAIDIDAPAGTDPSHPAFYLPGQETETGNIRAFGALEPCKEDGAACSAGSECCKGHCTQINPSTGIGVCGELMVNQCSRLDDKCTADTDCCTDPQNGALGRKLYCIAGFCAEHGVK